MKILAICLILCLIHPGVTFSSTIRLNDPMGYISTNPNPVVKYFFNPPDSVILTWSKSVSIPNFCIKIGNSPHNYNLGSIPLSGNRGGFIPANLPFNLPTGKYYGRITNSSMNTYESIEQDWEQYPDSIETSNEVRFVIQAPYAPYAVAPRGDITNATPVFQWNPVAGVPAYWIIVSSTPFTISTDSLDNISVSGLNIVWDYITTETSATYGLISPVSPFTQSAIPLIPENTYNYTILNLFDPTNVAFASSVFGGCTAFTLHSPNTLLPPNLEAPPDSSVFSTTPVIRFQWDPVWNANSYSIHLFNRVKQWGGNNQEIDVPVWSTSTTNTIVDFPAQVNISKGKYPWFVIANSSSGAGSMSSTRIFNYTCPTGVYRVSATSVEDSSALMNFQFTIHSTTGGFSPTIPFTVSNSTTYTDSIPVDSYIFTASKPGYFDSTVNISILEGQTKNYVRFRLRAYPVTANGIVKDTSNNPVSGANVSFTNILNNSVLSIATSSSGNYSILLPKGNYSVTANKPGYLSPPAISISADSDNIQIPLITMTYDNAVISGKVFNDNNEPVQLANLNAVKGTVTQQAVTDGSGNYSFNLSSGQWTLTVSKTGFISPASKNYNLSPGDNIQSQNFTLIPRANQVNGVIYKLVTNSLGQTSPVPFPGITVTGSPGSGQPVTAVSNASGQYTLNLGSGSWSINASQSGYSSGNPVQMTLTIAQTISGVDFTLAPNPCTVAGTITDPGGMAIDGAVVFVQNISTTNSLSSGSYVLSLPAGSFTLNCSKQGYISPPAVILNLNAGQNLNGINFQLTPNAGIISGLVSSSGQPLGSAIVSALQQSATVSVNTAQDGTFTLNVQPGLWNIHASKPGFITSADSVVTIGSGQTKLNTNFNLLPNTALLNGVVKCGSTLIGSAQILITEVANTSNSISTQSNINGEFSVTLEAGKNYNISVSNTGYISQTKLTGTLLPAASINLTFDMVPISSSFSGKVNNNLQVPLEAVKIYLAISASGVIIDSTVTDVTGSYTIGASAGTYKLTAFKRGYTSDNTTLQITIGQTLTNINFTLNENFALLSGNVKDNSGVPVQGVLVNLTSPSGGATTTTSSTGDYVFSRLLGDNYLISFSKQSYADTLISNYLIHDGESKTINAVLRKLIGKINGKITNVNLIPIPLATVNAVKLTNLTFSAITDNNGNYEIAALDTGNYIITANKTGYTSTQQVPVLLTFQNTSGSANITDFSQNKGNVYGLVKDNSGNPVIQASVNISGTSGSASAVSGNDGKFSLTNLVNGQYTFDCSKTGYPPYDTTVIVTDSVFVPVTLKPNNSSISGFVKDQLNHALPYVVSVTAVSTQKSIYHTTSDLTGYFEFHNVDLNSVYMIYTEIFKEGIINDTIFNINVTTNQPFAGPEQILVTVKNSLIKGNVGTSSVLVKLTNLATNEIKNTTSSGTGLYQFGFISAGAYRIQPVKTGFIFKPVSKDTIIAASDSVTVDFLSIADVGSISITAVDSGGHPIAGVSVVAINDSGLVFPGTTDNNGSYLFSGISSGNYILKLSKQGYSVKPDSAIAIVSNGVTVNRTFILTLTSGSVAGLVYQYANSTLSNSQNASINLRNLTTGQVFTNTSTTNGTFKIPNLTSGSYKITASKAGYLTDSLFFNLTDGETKTNVSLTLKVSYVKLTGKVVYNNVGLSGVIVNAISSSSLTDTTDSNGNFSFDNAAIKTNAGDTTSFQISISYDGFTPQSKIIAVPGSMIGNIIPIPQFILPSGQISLSFTDQIYPITGIKIFMTYPDGRLITSASGLDGKFISTANLDSGTYKLSFSKSGILFPADSLLKINLTSDTLKVSKSFSLPYSYQALSELKPTTQNKVQLFFTVKPMNASASLFYKLKSAVNFVQTQMALTDSSFYGIIPALYSSEDVIYYMTIIDHSANDAIYISAANTITPSGEGILSSLIVKPDLENLLLRKDDVINLSLLIKDGKNLSLAGQFTGPSSIGHLTWQFSNPDAGNFSFPLNNDSTSVNLQLKKEGAYKLKVSAALYGISLTSSFDVQVISPVLRQITVSAPAPLLSNKSDGLQLTFSAIDTGGRNVYLGNSVLWSVSPVSAGTISQSGFFKPVDSTFIGIISVTAQDRITGLKGSSEVIVYADIYPAASYILTDNEGMTLSLQSGAVNGITKIWLSKPQTGPGKKNYAPLNNTSTYVVSDKQYQIVYNADIGLPGDSLNKPAELGIPVDNSLRFMEGSKFVAMYDNNKLNWIIKSTKAGNSGNYSTSEMYKFGEYSLLSLNEPLGLKYISILPSPFSPQVAPVKIGYFLSTNAPPAFVTIRIYNVRGELVRTIIENSQQFAGVYGGRKGKLQLEWDGKTNSGLLANNGRYIIQITAKDNSGEISELKQVVLIK